MIKNIIFDFGDIFINLDKQGTYKAMAALGVTEITEEMMQVYHQYEKGLMTTENFIDFFFIKFNIPKKDLINAWNAVLLDFPKRRLDFLTELAKDKKYRLFLLSNTNDLHINWVQNSLGKSFRVKVWGFESIGAMDLIKTGNLFISSVVFSANPSFTMELK